MIWAELIVLILLRFILCIAHSFITSQIKWGIGRGLGNLAGSLTRFINFSAVIIQMILVEDDFFQVSAIVKCLDFSI